MLSTLKLPKNEWNPDIPDPITKYKDIISKLRKAYKRGIKEPTKEEFEKFKRFSAIEGIQGWEAFFVPEENFYKPILGWLSAEDVIFDVGAGDLRFDLLLAERVKKVYAIELNPEIIGPALKIIGLEKPRNLIAICGNAFDMDIPSDVTYITCLMIHREHDFPKQWRKVPILFCKKGIETPIFLDSLDQKEGKRV